MRVKISRNRKAGETIASYYKMKVAVPFRYTLANRVLESCGTDATAIVDTNMTLDGQTDERIEAALQAAGIEFSAWPVKEDSRKLFGIPTDFMRRKSPRMRRQYVMDLTGAVISEALFLDFFRYFDLALGLGRQIPLDALLEKLKTEPFDEMLFDPQYFAASYYDSVVCTTVRSTIDIAPFVREIGL